MPTILRIWCIMKLCPCTFMLSHSVPSMRIGAGSTTNDLITLLEDGSRNVFCTV